MITPPVLGLVTLSWMPSAKAPLNAASALARLWLMMPLPPSIDSATILLLTSPPTSKVSEPAPPISVVTSFGLVLSTKKWSSPSRPSTSSRSTPTNSTFSPAPCTPSLVMTKLSFSSVPMTTTVSTPAPPSIFTGALMLYCTVSSPSPPLTSVWSPAMPPPASTKARTMKVSLPSSPNSLSTALLL